MSMYGFVNRILKLHIPPVNKNIHRDKSIIRMGSKSISGPWPIKSILSYAYGAEACTYKVIAGLILLISMVGWIRFEDIDSIVLYTYTETIYFTLKEPTKTFKYPVLSGNLSGKCTKRKENVFKKTQSRMSDNSCLTALEL